MDALGAVHDLRHAEIDPGRDNGDRFVLIEASHLHQKTARLAECVLHRKIERRRGINLSLSPRTEFGEVVWMAEAGKHPLHGRLDQRVGESSEAAPLLV